MTEPIISPWIIYWFSVYVNFQKFVEICFMISVIAGGLALVFYTLSYVSDTNLEDDKEVINLRKVCKKFIMALVIFTGLNMFTPPKEIALSMIVAQNVTPQRVEQTLELTDEAINYVGEKGEKAIERTTEILTDNVIKVIKAAQNKE